MGHCPGRGNRGQDYFLQLGQEAQDVMGESLESYELSDTYVHVRTKACVCRGPVSFMDLGSNIVSMSEKPLKNLHTDGRADPLFIRYGEIQNS